MELHKTRLINAEQQQLRKAKCFIRTRDEHNHDISTGKFDARLVLKNIRDLSEVDTPTVVVAPAIQPIKDNLATQLALATKENLFRTAQRIRKQREQVFISLSSNKMSKYPSYSKNLQDWTVNRILWSRKNYFIWRPRNATCARKIKLLFGWPYLTG